MKFKKTVFLFSVLFPLLLMTQQVKIKKVNLKNFPRILLTISIESEWGVPIPVNTKKMQLFEQNQKIKNIEVLPLDSVNVPIYTVVILDKSGSMKGEAIKNARRGAVEFIKMMKRNDKAAYIEFDTRVKVLEKFTSDQKILIKKINQTVPGSDTAILDGLYEGIELLKKEPQN